MAAIHFPRRAIQLTSVSPNNYTQTVGRLGGVKAGVRGGVTPHASKQALASAARREVKQAPGYAMRTGQFLHMSAAQRLSLQQTFLEAARTNFKTSPNGEPSRFTMEDLSVNFNGMASAAHSLILERGRAPLGRTVLYTSGAGLWERGMNQPKALIPYNLVDLLSPEALTRLEHLSDVNSAKGPADVLFVAGIKEVPEGETIERLAARTVADAKREADAILSKVKKDPRAMNPLVMKFAKAAVASKVSGSFVPLLVGTSEQTHGQIFDFYNQFRKDFATRPLHADPILQKELAAALKAYFMAADELGYHPIFGRQEGIGLLDANGAEVPGTQLIGEGAGSAKSYMDNVGLTRKFQAMGKDRWQFENIEVMTDQLAAASAHEIGGKRLSVVLVPQIEGYAGGNPFNVRKADGRRFLELHEQSAVPDELATGNAVFNTNTITMPLDLGAPNNPGFEPKRGGYRIKLNVGNITQDVQALDMNATADNVGTSGIGGVIGVDYENFKNYREYHRNGTSYLETHQNLLARDLRLAKSQPNALDWP